MSSEEGLVRLEPCPFCGGEASLNDDKLLVWYRCAACDIEGPAADDEGDARRAWNTRAPRTAPSDGEVEVELWLCESRRLFLKPDQRYRFKVDPHCEQCTKLASAATPSHRQRGMRP